MSEEKKAETMRKFAGSIETKDVETPLSLCADDITWHTPVGTFKGKEEVKKYLNWVAERIKNPKLTDSGVGILIQGDKASYEHTFSGTIEGEKVSYPMLCTYEFDEDGKIKSLKSVYDRLAIAEQATNKWLPKKIVRTLVSQLQKGLD